jgi:hypothetical protein
VANDPDALLLVPLLAEVEAAQTDDRYVLTGTPQGPVEHLSLASGVHHGSPHPIFRAAGCLKRRAIRAGVTPVQEGDVHCSRLRSWLSIAIRRGNRHGSLLLKKPTLIWALLQPQLSFPRFPRRSLYRWMEIRILALVRQDLPSLA